MPKPLKPIIFMVLLLAVGLFSSFNPAFAADTESSHITETVLFGNLKDDGSACGVFTVLNLIVDIFSITVGVLAVIGITIVGTKYLTAGGNEEQTRKAKQRMLQIVIGLVTYAVIYVGLQWLMPGGKLDFGKRCATISNEELANIKAQEKAEKQATSPSGTSSSSEADKQTNSSSSSATSSGNSPTSSSSGAPAKSDATCQKNAIKIVKDAGICKTGSASERIYNTAKLLAWPKGTNKKIYSKKPTPAYKTAINQTMKFSSSQAKYPYAKGRSCSVFVTAVVRASGYDKKFASTGNKYSVASINATAKKSKKWKKVSPSKAVRGDIFAYKDNHHVLIYGGKKGSEHVWYQGDLGDYYGYTSYDEAPTKKKNVNVWHATGK